MSKFKKKIIKDTEIPFSFDQESWMAGFIAGLKHKSNETNENSSENKTSNNILKLNILFGTETGNAEGVAEDLSKVATDNGFKAKVDALDDISIDQFSAMKNVAIITSTYGEGEMPGNAQLFWDSLSSETVPKLNSMNYSVLALGDTSYDEFCHAGKLIDDRLEKLEARRILDRIDCDVDFEDLSEKWISTIITKLNPKKNKEFETEKPNKENDKLWNRKNPFEAEIISSKLLSGPNSKKEIMHYEIDLGNSGLVYEVGDSLSIIPKNKIKLVKNILKRLGVDNTYIPEGYENNIEKLLKDNYEILTPTKKFIEHIEKNSNDKELSDAIKNNDNKALENYKWGKDVLDFMNVNAKLKFNVEKFLNLLRPLQHRTYSISSSINKFKNQVHLTISSVRWSNKFRNYNGVCSTYLADECDTKPKIKIFFTPNNSFRLPKEKNKDIIMIGPGTGIAPFRAFLQERQIQKSKGKSWLFFGDQTKDNDFIYEKELKQMIEERILTKLDLAFSRDQEEKIYVQHKMYENKQELFKWIDNGAFIYVCGDMTYMAKDVENMLINIISVEKKCTEDDAINYLKDLKREKRYLRDVY